jgi:prepilin-type N-terminal cleavage/methylation domain-containing protein
MFDIMQTANNKGFTLLEMTIVMVVVAFLSGVILVGRSLIHVAELRATAQQLDVMNTAYISFRLKYNCLPGDCPNATALGFSGGFSINFAQNTPDNTGSSVWEVLNPVSSAHALSLITMQMVLPTQINGNNNATLDKANYENFISVALLNQANLIPGYYDARVRVPVKLSTVAGITSSGQFKKAFWQPYYLTSNATSLIDRSGHYYFAIATAWPTIGAATFLTTDAAALDAKIDDGMPITGDMRASTDKFIDDVHGPQYLAKRDDGTNLCLIADTIMGDMDDSVDSGRNEVRYNVENTGVRCAVVAKARI